MENTYADPSKSKDLLNLFKGVATTIASTEKIAFLGDIQYFEVLVDT